MRRDTSLEMVVEIEAPSTRIQTRKDIMLTPLKMMKQLIKVSEKKRKIPQVMKNMYFYPCGFHLVKPCHSTFVHGI